MNENMLPVGTVLRAGAYRIERQISSGGFGNTYVVRNISFDEVYAMKEFFMKGVNLRNGSDVTVSITDNKATFESQRNKFKKEAIRLRKLKNDHIVKVHDLFDENGTVYYVMNLIDGQSLCDLVKEKGPMGEEDALNVFRQMLDALSVVHSQEPQMLHLDIKPCNIMVDKAGNAFLLDFGSSKQVDTDHNMTSSAFTLTPGYAPSELIDGNKSRIGPWTDLYEVGATLYFLLKGKQPPTSSEISEGEEAFIFPDSVSERTRELILWLMSLSPKKRPQSVAEVKKWYEENYFNWEVDAILGESGTDDGGDETILGNGGDKKDIHKGIEPVNHPSNENTGLSNSSLLMILGIIIAVIVLLFCSKSLLLRNDRESDFTITNNVENDDSIVIAEDSVNVDMYGVIDESPITMHFMMTEPAYIEGLYYYEVNGYYYYNKYGLDNAIVFSGISKGDSLKLHITDSEGNFIEGFIGEYSDGVYHGRFLSRKGQELGFRVVQSNESN